MKRKCPNCKEYELGLKMLSFANSMDCHSCFNNYQYTILSKCCLSLLLMCIASVAVYIGIKTESFLTFAVLILAGPLLVELTFAKVCELELTGPSIRKERRRQRQKTRRSQKEY